MMAGYIGVVDVGLLDELQYVREQLEDSRRRELQSNRLVEALAAELAARRKAYERELNRLRGLPEPQDEHQGLPGWLTGDEDRLDANSAEVKAAHRRLCGFPRELSCR
jgi:hypothetical protein